jgi:hypothetical protein
LGHPCSPNVDTALDGKALNDTDRPVAPEPRDVHLVETLDQSPTGTERAFAVFVLCVAGVVDVDYGGGEGGVDAGDGNVALFVLVSSMVSDSGEVGFGSRVYSWICRCGRSGRSCLRRIYRPLHGLARSRMRRGAWDLWSYRPSFGLGKAGGVGLIGRGTACWNGRYRCVSHRETKRIEIITYCKW